MCSLSPHNLRLLSRNSTCLLPHSLLFPPGTTPPTRSGASIQTDGDWVASFSHICCFPLPALSSRHHSDDEERRSKKKSRRHDRSRSRSRSKSRSERPRGEGAHTPCLDLPMRYTMPGCGVAGAPLPAVPAAAAAAQRLGCAMPALPAVHAAFVSRCIHCCTAAGALALRFRVRQQPVHACVCLAALIWA